MVWEVVITEYYAVEEANKIYLQTGETKFCGEETARH